MMGFSPLDAKQLTYWEYTAMLTEWNARHETEEHLEAPDAAFVESQMRQIANMPGMLN